MIPGSANPLLLTSTDSGFAIERSLRFNSSDSAYLNRTPSAAGNRKTWTWSGWVKRSKLGEKQRIFTAGSDGTEFFFETTNGLEFYYYTNSYQGWCKTNAVFRDTSAWYHIILAVDTTQSTSSDRVKIYVNGALQSLNFASTFALNSELDINNSVPHYISRYSNSATFYLDCYLAEVNFIDGQALAPTDFGAFDDNGVWQAKEFTGSYTTPGTALASATGALPVLNTTGDYGGTVASGVRSDSNASSLTLCMPLTSQGGLSITDDVSPAGRTAAAKTVTNSGATADTSSYKYYGGSTQFDVSQSDRMSIAGSSDFAFGTGPFTVEFWYYNNNDQTGTDYNNAIGNIVNPTAGYWRIGTEFGNTGEVYFTSTTGGYADIRTGVNCNDGKWHHIAVVREGTGSNQFKIYIDGYQRVAGTVATNLTSTATLYLMYSAQSGTPNHYSAGSLQDVRIYKGVAKYTGNFTVPAVPSTVSNSFRLPFTDNSSTVALGYDQKETVTLNPKGGMDVVTYSGTGSAQSIGGLAFQPDFIWTKSRSRADSHGLHDSVRGRASNLYSDLTASENTSSATADLVSFNSDGYTLGTVEQTAMNRSGETYIAWAWKAGGAAVSNTDGSITSQVSSSTAYGFSIVSFTAGSSGSLGHGLNAEPSVVIFKNRDTAGKWRFYHKNVGTSNTLFLNTTEAATSSGERVTAVSSSTFTVGGTISGDDYIAYCWSEVAGFSKFGSYTGGTNNNTITLGFKPRYLLIKVTNTSDSWLIYDSERHPGNPVDDFLQANSSEAEATGNSNAINFLDDGFQLASTQGGTNGSGNTYIYAAYADRPGNNWTPNNLSAGIDLNATAKQNFDAVTYTGNGGTQSISSLAFQPDLVWVKSRSLTSSHYLTDSVRGATKWLQSNDTSAETTTSNSLTSFNSDGFTVGSGASFNQSGQTFVAWCWKAGGAAVSNTDGSINSSVSANPNFGFSVVSFTGTGSASTVGHGLNNAPSWVVVKRRSTNDWWVYHRSIGASNRLILNLNNSASTNNGIWNGTDPTSSVFSLGTSESNANGENYIGYVWSEVAGFSKFGTYSGGSGTQSITGLGFKPRWVMVKRTDSTSNWFIFDSARGPSSSDQLYADLSAQEQGGPTISFDNDGFTFQSYTGGANTSGGTYVYMAFAASIPGDPDNDSLVDTPTNVATPTDTGVGNEVVGNYATLNPLQSNATGPLANGNLEWGGTNAGNFQSSVATIGMSSGKWYAEFTLSGGATDTTCGIARLSNSYELVTTGWFVGGTATSYGYYGSNGNKINTGAGSSYGAAYADGNTIGVAFDADNGTLIFYKNGVSQGTAFTGLTGTFAFACTAYATNKWIANFGQRAFAYAAPSGYKALNTANLPTPTIADGSLYFDTKLYTSTGADLSVTGLQFSPDFVWVKNRATANRHAQFDIVRGPNKYISSTRTNAEATTSGGGYGTGTFNSFDTNGFTVGSDVGVNVTNYPSGDAHVAWAWDAGNGNNTYTVTVSGGKFYIDGVQQPTLTLAEGSTYKFDQADNTNNSHPLRFSTTSDGTHGGGSEYTTGVTTAGTPGSAGAFTQIVIAASAPTLYAYCTNHSGMGFQVNTSDTGGYTIPVGGLNSSAYDQSQTWSNLITPYLNSPLGSGDGTQIFDGSTSTATTSNNTSGAGIKFTPTSSISGIIELWLRNGDTNNSTFSYSLDGGSNFTNVTTVGGSGSYVNIGQQTITTTNGLIVRHVTTAGTNSVSWRKMRVSGKELLDPSVSVTNVPSIASQVMASPESGFSILSYTGDGSTSSPSIGHGLNAALGMVIIKNRDGSQTYPDWYVKHKDIGDNYNTRLNLTAGRELATGWYQGGIGNLTSSSVISFVTGSQSSTGNVNTSGTDYIAYCFAPVAGYSAMGSYEGNGSTDGSFVFTNFRPKWILLKNITSTYNWYLFDTVRSTFNVVDDTLLPNTSSAEATDAAYNIDVLSNGFKLRTSNVRLNASSNTYIYIAFAENPFQANGGLAR